jgi:hypothetical protein
MPDQSDLSTHAAPTGAEPAPTPPAPPAWARIGAILLSGVLIASVPPVYWLIVARADAVLWFSTIFETLVLAAGVFGVLSGLGRFRDGWALSLICVAGTVLVCGVFAFVEIRANFGSDAGVAGLLKPYLAGRLGLAAGLALVASAAVFSRNPASWKALLRGLAVLAPAVAVLAWLFVTGGSFLGATRATPGAEAARILMLSLGGLVLIVLISVGGHLLIRAFEHGRPAGERPEDAEPA